MGLLHRLFARHSPEVWQAEARLLHRLGYVQPPEAVQWISTSICDLSCPHCYSHAGKKSAGELTTEEARTLLLDSLVELERPTFVIAGGETLLRKDFAEIIAHAHHRQIPWAIHTHGGRVEQLQAVFERYPPIMAAVSLDGPREYHDSFRGQQGSFDAALRAISTLKRLGCPEVVAGTTITRWNADLVADMVPVILESEADSWGLHLMTPEGRAHDHLDLLPTRDQLRRVASLARRLRSVLHVELDNEWGSAGSDDCFYRDSSFTCGAGRFSCVVSATGEVMPCTTTDGSESQGNIRERPLHEIWAQGFEAFRTDRDPLRSDCTDCWLQTRHGHSCRAPAFFTDLFAEEPPSGSMASPLVQVGVPTGGAA
jgi:radical SAM protein with 4Fe4S-binding SPASM domain